MCGMTDIINDGSQTPCYILLVGSILFAFYFLSTISLSYFTLMETESLIPMITRMIPVIQGICYTLGMSGVAVSTIVIVLWWGLIVTSKKIIKIGLFIKFAFIVLGVTAGLTSFGLIVKEKGNVKDFLHGVMKEENSEYLSGSMDALQSELNCCGVENYLDYTRLPNVTCCSDIVNDVCICALPISCCTKTGVKSMNGRCKVEIFYSVNITIANDTYGYLNLTNVSQSLGVHDIGCLDPYNSYINKTLVWIMTDTIIFLCLGFLSIWMEVKAINLWEMGMEAYEMPFYRRPNIVIQYRPQENGGGRVAFAANG